MRSNRGPAADGGEWLGECRAGRRRAAPRRPWDASCTATVALASGIGMQNTKRITFFARRSGRSVTVINFALSSLAEATLALRPPWRALRLRFRASAPAPGRLVPPRARARRRRPREEQASGGAASLPRILTRERSMHSSSSILTGRRNVRNA